MRRLIARLPFVRPDQAAKRGADQTSWLRQIFLSRKGAVRLSAG